MSFRETIVCLDNSHTNEEIQRTFDLLRGVKATRTDMDGFTWSWVCKGELPKPILAGLRVIDACIDTRHQPEDNS